jgi:hypothetical protein
MMSPTRRLATHDAQPVHLCPAVECQLRSPRVVSVQEQPGDRGTGQGLFKPGRAPGRLLTDNMFEDLCRLITSLLGGDDGGDSGDAGDRPAAIATRDYFAEARPEILARFHKAFGTPYTIDPNWAQLSPICAAAGHPDPGNVATEYFKGALWKTEELTLQGTDPEAMYLFNLAVPNRHIVIVFDPDTPFYTCGLQLKRGNLEIVVKPEHVFVAANRTSVGIDTTLDVGWSAPRPL